MTHLTFLTGLIFSALLLRHHHHHWRGNQVFQIKSNRHHQWVFPPSDRTGWTIPARSRVRISTTPIHFDLLQLPDNVCSHGKETDNVGTRTTSAPQHLGWSCHRWAAGGGEVDSLSSPCCCSCFNSPWRRFTISCYTSCVGLHSGPVAQWLALLPHS